MNEVLIALQGTSKIKPLSKEYFLKTHPSWTERKFRKEIASLREKGFPIISSSGTYGYWLSDKDSNDFKVFKAEIMHRIQNMSHMIKVMEGVPSEEQERMTL